MSVDALNAVDVKVRYVADGKVRHAADDLKVRHVADVPGSLAAVDAVVAVLDVADVVDAAKIAVDVAVDASEGYFEIADTDEIVAAPAVSGFVATFELLRRVYC